MKSPISICVRHKSIPTCILLPRTLKKSICVLSKVISINEVTARVIRRVDIDHLYLTEIGFLQKFQGIEIVPFNKEIFGSIEIHAFFAARSERLCNGCVCGKQCFPLAGPVQMVALLWPFHD